MHADAESSANLTLPLSDFLGDGVLALRERLLDTPDSSLRFSLVENWLLTRMHARYATSPLVRWALTRIEATRGTIGVEDLADEAGVSRKHLSRRFRIEIGLTTKTLARVHRFKHAMDWLSQQERVAWGELASICGYYDQSHLIRDFRDFSGMAPGDFIRRAKPDSGSVVVD